MSYTRAMYYDPQTIDLAKMQKDALMISMGDHRTPGTDVVIHHHKHAVKCDAKKYKHELYHQGEVFDGLDRSL